MKSLVCLLENVNQYLDKNLEQLVDLVMRPLQYHLYLARNINII